MAGSRGSAGGTPAVGQASPRAQRPLSQTLPRSAAHAVFGQAVSRTRSAARPVRRRAAGRPGAPSGPTPLAARRTITYSLE